MSRKIPTLARKSIAVFFTLLLSIPAIAEQNIVALLSYDASQPWSREFTEGLIKEAAKSREKTHLYIEYLDGQRLPSSQWFDLRIEYLQDKYQTLQVDAVIAESNHAARFLSEHGEQLFGSAARITVSENRFSPAYQQRGQHIPLLPDFEQSLNFANRLVPDAPLIAIIGDRSQEAAALAIGLRQAASRIMPDSAVELQMSDDLQVLKDYVSALPESAILFHTLYFPSGISGPHPSQAVAALAKVSKAPMLVSYSEFLPAGATGGVLLSPEQAAVAAMHSALSLLEGPFLAHSHGILSESWINYPQLQRYSIPARRIPMGSKILEPPSSLDTKDRYQFFGSIIFILLQMGLLVGLSILLRQRNRLMRSLLEINSQLEEKVNERTQELRLRAVTDSLTGLYNRAEFTRLALAAINQAQRNQSNLCVAMLDLDHFKRINDQFGHTAGDKVLQEVVNRLRNNLRNYDIIGRYGGEEFSVLLPDTELAQAVAAIDSVRELIAAKPIEIDSGRSVHVTMSAGVSPMTAQRTGLGELIKSADIQLYAAKESGRNRVCFLAAEAA